MKKFILFLITFFMIGTGNVKAYDSDIIKLENVAVVSSINYLNIEQNVTLIGDLSFDADDTCESYLGNPDNKNAPAYYLQFLFNLMKYIAIVLLFVMTVVEFAKATVSSNQDAIQKAMQNTVKRIIIAIVIIMLPTLIKLVLTWLGVYAPGTCGIS